MDTTDTVSYETALDDFRRLKEGTRPILELIEQCPDGEVPVFNFMTGGYNRTAVYDPDEWATFPWAGFLAGRLWLIAHCFADQEFARAARRLTDIFGERLAARPPRFSAAGIDIFYGLCLGARITRDAVLAEKALAAVQQYARNFDQRSGIFFQVKGTNRAVIDTGLNLLPFYWASAYQPSLREYAVTHNRTLLRAGIIRDDGSTYQAIEYDTDSGMPFRHYTLQGYADKSTWARGQAWAIHNYINAYEATGDDEFLAAGRSAARWYVEHLPEDRVPFYDFDDPTISAVPKDSCSAAISANALLRLSRLDPSTVRWAESAAYGTLASLRTNYLSRGGVLLHGSWGRLRADKATAGITRFPLEEVMPYGNYWIVEMLYRLVSPDWTLLALDGASETGGHDG